MRGSRNDTTRESMQEFALPAIVSRWQQEIIPLDGIEIQMTIPADPDELLQVVDQSEGEKRENFDPYWGHLWPAARKMAMLVSQFNWKSETRILELGCGSGLLGVAALAAGMRVTFSDHQPEALQLSACNAIQNGYQAFDVLLFDWFAPAAIDPFPIVIASDVLYEERFHQPLLDLLQRVTTREGEAWIADPGRSLLSTFLRMAQQHNFQIAIYDENLKEKFFPGIGHFQVVRLKKR